MAVAVCIISPNWKSPGRGVEVTASPIHVRAAASLSSSLRTPVLSRQHRAPLFLGPSLPAFSLHHLLILEASAAPE